jgi:hypothetical protein
VIIPSEHKQEKKKSSQPGAFSFKRMAEREEKENDKSTSEQDDHCSPYYERNELAERILHHFSLQL